MAHGCTPKLWRCMPNATMNKKTTFGAIVSRVLGSHKVLKWRGFGGISAGFDSGWVNGAFFMFFIFNASLTKSRQTMERDQPRVHSAPQATYWRCSDCNMGNVVSGKERCCQRVVSGKERWGCFRLRTRVTITTESVKPSPPPCWLAATQFTCWQSTHGNQ